MPPEMEVNRLACDEPTRRTVDVEQFCSWSACRMNSMSRALATFGVDLVRLGGRTRSSAGSSPPGSASCPGTGTAGRWDFVAVRGDGRHLGEQPDGGQFDLLRIVSGRESVVRC